MISVTVKDSDSWSLDYAINAYNQTKEIQGYILWRSKKELKHGQIEEFYKSIGVPDNVAIRHIRHFEAKLLMSNPPPGADLSTVTEMEAVEIVSDEDNPINDISVSVYASLKGDTPQEKLEYKEKVKEHTGKDNVTRRDVESFNKGDGTALTEKEAVIQTNKEYDQDYWNLCSGDIGQSLDVFNIGFEIHKFDDRWNAIKKILVLSAHPDKGGSDDAMNFVSLLNEIFKDKKKNAKEMKLKKDMTDRITDLMGVTNVQSN